MADMYIKLTSLQHNKLKKFITTCTVKGYEIDIYQQIVSIINSPFVEGDIESVISNDDDLPDDSFDISNDDFNSVERIGEECNISQSNVLNSAINPKPVVNTSDISPFHSKLQSMLPPRKINTNQYNQQPPPVVLQDQPHVDFDSAPSEEDFENAGIGGVIDRRLKK